MLLWEALTVNGGAAGTRIDLLRKTPITPRRLPFETRCGTITKRGKRCRGKIRGGGDTCPLHNPTVAARRKIAAGRPRKPRNPLSRLPDGYLRKLSNYAAVGNAMDRLYREVRLGVITPGMGRVLFDILARLMDTGLLENTRNVPRHRKRTKAVRLRPKMEELLTRAEKIAWHKAVAGAAASEVRREGPTGAETPATAGASPTCTAPSIHRLERSRKLSLQAAS